MEHTEYECTILNIDLAKIISKLESLGAKDKGEFLQRRYVYDFNPVDKFAWIRLRTNGKKTTLAIKRIKDKNAIGGTRELEMEVEDFDTTNEFLYQLGYNYRAYQENRRHSYELNGVSIEIDSWPMIPTYVEIEGSSESEVLNTLHLLDLANAEVTTYDVESIYREIYGINLLELKEVKFEDESLLEHNKHL